MKDSICKNFTLILTTHNRLEELRFTLKTLKLHIKEGLQIIVCDDGSKDNTSNYIKKEFPQIKLITNKSNKGLIYSRNLLMNMVNTPYAVSLDDDAHFLQENSFHLIESFFEAQPKCGVVAFRIFWGKSAPVVLRSKEKTERVRGFVGCGHAWRMDAWKAIPDYPSWFEFYGEEDFASYELFKTGWGVYYLPEVLVQHRVNVRERKLQADYVLRLRQSLRAGWYLYFLFFPIGVIPRKLIYSIWMQLKLKIFKGDWKALKAMSLAFGDVLINLKRIKFCSNRFSSEEMAQFFKLTNTKIYWIPYYEQK